VRQPHPSNGATTITVYDAFGRAAAEYSNQAPTGPAGLVYRMADHLGSTRLAMQGSSVLARYDYLPFGERIGSGINGRSSLYGSTGSMAVTGQDQVVEQQFTAKERDAESGLDYFGARFFMAPTGRFLSPDAPFADQFVENPQSWNLYSYTRNNPLRYVDENGRAAQAAVVVAVKVLGGATTGGLAGGIGASVYTLGSQLASGTYDGQKLLAAGVQGGIVGAVVGGVGPDVVLGSFLANPGATTAGLSALNLAAGEAGRTAAGLPTSLSDVASDTLLGGPAALGGAKLETMLTATGLASLDESVGAATTAAKQASTVFPTVGGRMASEAARTGQLGKGTIPVGSGALSATTSAAGSDMFGGLFQRLFGSAAKEKEE